MPRAKPMALVEHFSRLFQFLPADGELFRRQTGEDRVDKLTAATAAGCGVTI